MGGHPEWITLSPDGKRAYVMTMRAREQDIRAVQEALAPWTDGRDYMNFREVELDSDRFYSGSVLARLHAVRAEHDPDGTIRTAHPLTVA